MKIVAWKCSDCRDHHTEGAAVEHAKPEVCSEWSNHAMFEATFTPVVYEVCEKSHTPMFVNPWNADDATNFCRVCGVWFVVEKVASS